MKSLPAIRSLFTIAAIYDGILGIVFLFFGAAVFDCFNVTPPNHWGYVQFSALILLIFAIMFAAIAIAPLRNRNLVPYGMLLKISYSGIVFYYWAVMGIPTMWKPFAVTDVIFLLLFGWAYAQLRSGGKTDNTAPPTFN